MNAPPSAACRLKSFWRDHWVDALSLLSLFALAGVMLQLSWRRWPDPVVDFPRLMYTVWRMSEGDVFARDIDVVYGPLSLHLLAMACRFIGVGIMQVVAINLAIHGAMLVACYAALRSGWGRLGAWTGTAVFVTVFSFLQLTGISNYNYATPYCEEAGQGLFACICMVLALQRWRRSGSRTMAALAGLMLGATAVLKVECLIAAIGVASLALALHLREGKAPRRSEVGLFLAAAAVPYAAFAAYFMRLMPWTNALSTAGMAIFNLVGNRRYVGNEIQKAYAGLDAPARHLEEHLVSTLVAVALVACLIAASHVIGRLFQSRRLRWAGGAMAVGLVATFACAGRSALPHNPGEALLGLAIIGTGLAAWDWERSRRGGSPDPAAEARLLAGSLAVLMMLRMVLASRIYHYGYYQAALAGMVVAAALSSDWIRFAANEAGARIASLTAIAFLAVIAIGHVLTSNTYISLRTLAVGTGADRIYHIREPHEHMGEIVRQSADFVSTRTKPSDRVLVVPEGIAVNYLARRRSPLPTVNFFGPEFADGGEAKIVAALERSRPEYVIVMSRDLREWGISRYGEAPGKGELLLNWLFTYYRQVATLGGNPLYFDRRGACYFRLKPEFSPPAGGR